jgi:hypothetical protein
MSKTNDLLLDIATEKNGFQIGDPWRFSEFSLCAIIPITRKVDFKREYLILNEAERGIKIKDTGSINQMEITNMSGLPVLLKAGDILLGATQERVIITSQVVMDKETVIVGCACVHSTKGIRAGQTVKPGGIVPEEIRKAVYQSYLNPHDPISVSPARINTWDSWVGRQDQQIADAAYHRTPGYQQGIWGAVKTYSARARNVSSSESFRATARNYYVHDMGLTGGAIPNLEHWTTPTDDMAGRLQETGKKFEAVVKKAPEIKDQVGMCLVTLDGFDTLDIFDHPESWDAIRKHILQSDAATIANSANEDVFGYKPEKAKEVIRKLLSSSFGEQVVLDKPGTMTIAITKDKLTGEVVTLNDKPIHLALVKNS